jgi:hypothetical protein
MNFSGVASPGRRMLETPVSEKLVDLSAWQLHLVLSIAQPSAA